jgi:hypothetical protein
MGMGKKAGCLYGRSEGKKERKKGRKKERKKGRKKERKCLSWGTFLSRTVRMSFETWTFLAYVFLAFC